MTESTHRDSIREKLKHAKQRHERGYAQPWEPDAGEIIVGELVDYQEDVKTQYGVSDVAEIKPDDGPRKAVWLFHEVLADQWSEKDPTIGDRVGVLYYGKTNPSNGGSSYHNYEVEVQSVDESEEQPTESSPSGNGQPDPPEDDIPF